MYNNNHNVKRRVMMTASLEEYLKTIYILYNKNGVARVTDIALEMNCTKPSVNRALKILKEEEYIDYKAYGSINLTLKGEKQAKKIIRSQIAIESFLTDICVSGIVCGFSLC